MNAKEGELRPLRPREHRRGRGAGSRPTCRDGITGQVVKVQGGVRAAARGLAAAHRGRRADDVVDDRRRSTASRDDALRRSPTPASRRSCLAAEVVTRRCSSRGARRTRRSAPSSSPSSTTHTPRRGRAAATTSRATSDDDDELVPQWVRDWQATLFDHGWMIPGYPPELGGRNCTPVQTLIYLEELASRRIPRVGPLPRLRDRRAEPARVRQRRAEGARAGRDPRRHDLVHRHERAERGLRPRRPADARRGARRTTSSSTARRCGRRYAMIAQKCFCYVRTDPDAAEAQGHLAAHHRHGHAGHRRPPAAPHQRHGRTSPRCSSPTSIVPRENLVGELNGGWAHHAGLARARARRAVGRGRRPARADASTGSSSSPSARAATDDPVIRRKIAAGLRAARRACARSATRASRRSRRARRRPSTRYMKMATSEAGKAAFELGMEICRARSAR